jgi:hypothetical protein
MIASEFDQARNISIRYLKRSRRKRVTGALTDIFLDRARLTVIIAPLFETNDRPPANVNSSQFNLLVLDHY